MSSLKRSDLPLDTLELLTCAPGAACLAYGTDRPHYTTCRGTVMGFIIIIIAFKLTMQ